jgi:hypothetical protein
MTDDIRVKLKSAAGKVIVDQHTRGIEVHYADFVQDVRILEFYDDNPVTQKLCMRITRAIAGIAQDVACIGYRAEHPEENYDPYPTLDENLERIGDEDE